MNGVLIALLLVQSPDLVAQNLSFLLPQRIQIGPQCCSVLTGDFNRDGNPDIAVANSVAGITVLLGDGKGGFTRLETAKALPDGMTITGLVATADINSDGITDILAIADPNTHSGLVSVALIGRSDGTFPSPVVLGPDIVKAIGDFNGDGRPDLLVWATGIGDLGQLGFAVRFGNGDGTFRPTGPLTPFTRTGDFAWAVAVDFNHDGKADVAQTSFRHFPSVFVWKSNGDGTFRDAELYSLSSQATGAMRLAVGDFNRDGNPDFAVLAPGHPMSGVEIALGKVGGTFQTGVSYQLTDTSADSNAGNPLAVADFNGDGLLDVVEGFTFLLGNGDGSLQSPVSFGQFYIPPQTSLPFAANRLAVADFNGDGKPDLVAASGGDTGITLLINNSGGPDGSVNAVSAASYVGLVSPGSIATVFGKNFAPAIASATLLPLPTVLQNTSVRVLDQLGVEHLAGLIYVSPSQINFLIPPDTAEGSAIINVDNGKLPAGTRSTIVQVIAPAFFTLDGTGLGAPAATAVRVQADGTQTPVVLVQCTSQSCSPVPIDLSVTGTVYLSLYGTGFDAASAPGVGCSAGSVPIRALFAGRQGQYPGLDQLNLQLPKTLPSGPLALTCSFDVTNQTGATEVGSTTVVTILVK
jgi:uncharacterized protein (TIGR03437 family)